MKFYRQDKNGNRVEITEKEARKHLSEAQIAEGIEAKRADPLEEVSYMAGGGCFIIIDF